MSSNLINARHSVGEEIRVSSQGFRQLYPALTPAATTNDWKLFVSSGGWATLTCAVSRLITKSL